MKILNLTHGSFYLLGGYIGLAVVHTPAALCSRSWSEAGPSPCIGASMERFFLRRFHLEELPQTLLTFGFLFIFSDLAMVIWGGNPQTHAEAGDVLASRLQLARSLIRPIACSLSGLVWSSPALLWWLQEGTRVGAMLRAGVDDEEIARALGINVSLLFTLVFALGAFLAALGGVMGGPIMGVYPGADFEVCCSASSSSSSAGWEA